MSSKSLFYDLEFKDSTGKLISMSSYKGYVLLLVNTATKCGLAPQFEELEALSRKFKDRKFLVIGFPSNQFAGQEPETNDSVVSVCRLNFGVTFLLSEKVLVNGKDAHPVFKFLKNSAGSGLFGKRLKWNFTKFLVSSDGTRVKRFSPLTKPHVIEKDILAWLE